MSDLDNLIIRIDRTGVISIEAEGKRIGLIQELYINANVSDKIIPEVTFTFPDALPEKTEEYRKTLLRCYPAVTVYPPLKDQKSGIIAFYEGHGLDHEGRNLDYILSMGDEWFERSHDHIQWIFPTNLRSQYNSMAPILTDEEINQFKSRPDLKNNLRKSWDRAVRFWKLGKEKKPWWVRKGDHNHLRLTRALTSLTLLGLDGEANWALEELMTIYDENQDEISQFTAQCWTRAIHASNV